MPQPVPHNQYSGSLRFFNQVFSLKKRAQGISEQGAGSF
jgi:hypothetical protein